MSVTYTNESYKIQKKQNCLLSFARMSRAEQLGQGRGFFSSPGRQADCEGLQPASCPLDQTFFKMSGGERDNVICALFNFTPLTVRDKERDPICTWTNKRVQC